MKVIGTAGFVDAAGLKEAFGSLQRSGQTGALKVAHGLLVSGQETAQATGFTRKNLQRLVRDPVAMQGLARLFSENGVDPSCLRLRAPVDPVVRTADPVEVLDFKGCQVLQEQQMRLDRILDRYLKAFPIVAHYADDRFKQGRAAPVCELTLEQAHALDHELRTCPEALQRRFAPSPPSLETLFTKKFTGCSRSEAFGGGCLLHHQR